MGHAPHPKGPVLAMLGDIRMVEILVPPITRVEVLGVVIVQTLVEEDKAIPTGEMGFLTLVPLPIDPSITTPRSCAVIIIVCSLVARLVRFASLTSILGPFRCRILPPWRFVSLLARRRSYYTADPIPSRKSKFELQSNADDGNDAKWLRYPMDDGLQCYWWRIRS